MIHLRSAPSILPAISHFGIHSPINPPIDISIHPQNNRFRLSSNHPSVPPSCVPSNRLLINFTVSVSSIHHPPWDSAIHHLFLFHSTIQTFIPPLYGDSVHQSIHPFFPKSLPSVVPQSISSFIQQSIQSSIHHTLFYQSIHPSIHPSLRPSVDSFIPSSSSDNTSFLLNIDPSHDSTVHLSIQTSIKRFAHPDFIPILYPSSIQSVRQSLCHLKNTLSQAIHRFIHHPFVHQCILPSVHPSIYPVSYVYRSIYPYLHYRLLTSHPSSHPSFYHTVYVKRLICTICQVESALKNMKWLKNKIHDLLYK